MLRFLFRSLKASRLQAQARSPVRRPQPQLEAMEDRVTPSPLMHPADGNPNAVSAADNPPVARQEDQPSPNSLSATDHPDPTVPNKSDSDNGDSAIASKDLVFQRLHGGDSGISTPAGKDAVFQELHDSNYLVWVAGSHDPTPQASDNLDIFMGFGDYIHAIEAEITENAKINH